MDQATHNKIVAFIWGIADDVLRDLFRRGKYPDVILPMCVIRRMDAVLEPSKKPVLETKKLLDAARITEQRAALCAAAGQAFYNTSKFTLRDLKSRGSQQQLRADFEDYLNGFSPNVQDILENFKFRNQLHTLSKADALGTLINKFLDPDIDLSPAGIDNHSMGTVFEELVRRFNEENNEEAGEHWTPRDAVRLMANLVFLPIESAIKSGTYLLYDCACGTGGMLTVAEETLTAIGEKRGQQVQCLLYGQEINPETYAVCKADMLLKGEGESADLRSLAGLDTLNASLLLRNRRDRSLLELHPHGANSDYTQPPTLNEATDRGESQADRGGRPRIEGSATLTEGSGPRRCSPPSGSSAPVPAKSGCAPSLQRSEPGVIGRHPPN